MSASITVENAGRLDRRLKAMPMTLEQELERRGTREAAKRVQILARGAAPRGETGMLYRSIRIRPLPRRKSNVGWQVYIDRRILAMAGSRNNYAAFQEFGTKFVDAERYMERASKRSEGAVVRSVASSAKTGVNRGASRG